MYLGSVPCEDLPSDASIVATAYSQTLARADVTLTCRQKGARFTTGQTTIIVTCNFALNQWLTTVPQCVGMYGIELAL